VCWCVRFRLYKYRTSCLPPHTRRAYVSRTRFRRSHMVVKSYCIVPGNVGAKVASCEEGAVYSQVQQCVRCVRKVPSRAKCNSQEGAVYSQVQQSGRCRLQPSATVSGCRRQLAHTSPPSQPYFVVRNNRVLTTMSLRLNHYHVTAPQSLPCDCASITTIWLRLNHLLGK